MQQPAVSTVTTPLGRTKLVLTNRPGLQVIDLISTWQAESYDAVKTAKYLNLPLAQVLAVITYYTAHQAEVDADLKDHLDAQIAYANALKAR